MQSAMLIYHMILYAAGQYQRTAAVHSSASVEAACEQNCTCHTSELIHLLSDTRIFHSFVTHVFRSI